MHPFSIGVIVGFVLGMAVALGFAIYINRSDSPFVEKELPASRKELPPIESGKVPPRSAKAEAPKPKFEFYEILPGKQEAMPKPEAPKEPLKGVYLQAGAFQTSSEADNLKARLALLGIESQITTAHLPDDKTWHRVRVGPYDDEEAAKRVQITLQENDIKANVVGVKE